jgi:hypothetical protein
MRDIAPQPTADRAPDSAPAREPPPFLSRWSQQLLLLQPELRSVLGEAAQSLAAALLPRLQKHGRARTEPDGFAGIHRRGSPEHLLLTEWALAQEIPLEFLRRAAMSEQFYLQRALRDEPEQHCFTVLLDCGPAMLGAPRLVQLATLILLEQFALAQLSSVASRATMRFGCLQAPADGLAQGFGMAQVRRWSDMRTASGLTADHAKAWRELLLQDARDEQQRAAKTMLRGKALPRYETVYIVRGKATSASLFAEEFASDKQTQLIDVCVNESLLNHALLDVVVTAGTGQHARELSVALELPSDEQIVTMLRRPLAPRPRETAKTVTNQGGVDRAQQTLRSAVQVLIDGARERFVVRHQSGLVIERSLVAGESERLLGGLEDDKQDPQLNHVVAFSYLVDHFDRKALLKLSGDDATQIHFFERHQAIMVSALEQLSTSLSRGAKRVGSNAWFDLYIDGKHGFLVDDLGRCWSIFEKHASWGGKLIFKGHQTIDELIERHTRMASNGRDGSRKLSYKSLIQSYLCAARSRRANSLHYTLQHHLLSGAEGAQTDILGYGFVYRRNLQDFSMREHFVMASVQGSRGVWYGTHDIGSVVLGLCYLDAEGELVGATRSRLEPAAAANAIKQAGVVVYTSQAAGPQVIVLRRERKPFVLVDAAELVGAVALAWEASSTYLVWVEADDKVHVKRCADRSAVKS